MHELALAQEILAVVARHVPADRTGDVTAVRVRIGALAGVVPEALEFCFDVLVAGSCWSRAALVIEHVPARIACPGCGHEALSQTPGAGCPACGGGSVRLVAGQELHVDAVDLADDELAAQALEAPVAGREGRTA